MESADDAYFRETALLVAESQKMVAAAHAATHRAARAAEEIRKQIAESLELIEATKKVRKIKPAMVGGIPGRVL